MTRYPHVEDYANRLCERYESLLVLLVEAGTIERLIRVVDAATPNTLTGVGRSFSRRDLANAISDHEVGELSNRALELVDFLIDIVVTSRGTRTPLSALIEAISTALIQRLGHDSAPVARALMELTDLQPIALLAIDEDLLAENPAVYIDARLIRDFRPAYLEDTAGDPSGIERYVSQQKLRIRYWSEGRERVFEVTMRDDDLADLSSWIDRAQRKLPYGPTKNAT